MRFISTFEMFKIGIGPSSSHTMGPMVAGGRFLALLRDPQARAPGAGAPARLGARLHGSLAFTGKGHATDRATILGLSGFACETLDADKAEAELARIAQDKTIHVEGLPDLAFDPGNDLVFDYEKPLPGHPNGMALEARDAEGRIVAREVYYSIGGGFVQTESELARGAAQEDGPDVPHPFRNGAELIRLCDETGLSIAELMSRNELALRGPKELQDGLDRIWDAMNACIERGMATDGVLPGGLKIKRRAHGIRDQLEAERGMNMRAPHMINDWLLLYAIAVNEENAGGGQVVTAPTNGAAGVFPSVVRYYLDHITGATRGGVHDMLLTGAAIGGIVKRNASISGAELGCQAEVGSASAMAAAALCAVMGGDARQIENAAEIALEHHLGMTCDPVAGLVQAPCIERNGLGAVKAVTAASLSLRGDGLHFMPLDNCIEAMRQTGKAMGDEFKETSLGGLAVNVPNC